MDVFATGTEGPALRRAPGGPPPEPEAAPPAEPVATIDDRGAVVRQRVPIPARMQDVDPRFLRQRAAEILATRVPELVPVRRILRRGDEVLILSDADDGLPLARLLDRAKPSLAEAAALAATVLEALAGAHGAGHAHGGLDGRAVRIGRDGSARLAGWAANALFPAGLHDEVRRADVRAVALLVAEIARAAGRPTRALTDREERIATRLKAAADPRSLNRRGLLPAAHGLDAAMGPMDRREAAHQGVASLAAAVAALDGPAAGAHRDGETGLLARPAGFVDDDPLEVLDEVPEVLDDGPPGPLPPIIVADGSGPGAGPAGAGDDVLSAGHASAGRRIRSGAQRPAIWPRVWKGAALAAVVALILGVELRFFGDRVSRNVHVLLSGDVKTPAAPGPRHPGPMPVLGPSAAGPVTHLELRPLDTCKPAGPCTAVVQVTVTRVPQGSAPLDVAFGLAVVDRCRPGRDSRPGGVLSVPPGQDRAVQTVSLPLPEGRALAVIPLTTSPVTVAGTPLRVPGDNGPC